MEKEALKDILYGGLNEIVHNGRYYYHSGAGPTYSSWTEPGKIALTKYMLNVAELMFDVEHEQLDKRAKDLVLKGLKGDSI